MDTVEGTLIVGTVVKWFSVLAKGGRQLEPYGSSGRKHNLGDGKPRITIVRRSCEDGDQWNRWWGVRIEPKNTTEKRTQDTTQIYNPEYNTMIPESAVLPYHQFLGGYQIGHKRN